MDESERLKLDALHREISQMAATRIDLESRIERLKVEMATTAKSRRGGRGSGFHRVFGWFWDICEVFFISFHQFSHV